MAGAAVVFGVKADTSSFDKTLAGLKSQTDKASKSIDSSMSGAFDAVQNSANTAGNAITLGLTAPLVAIGALAGNTAVKFAKLYETTMIVFDGMLGGKDAASALYGSLLDIARGSTFAQETFLTCGKKLVGMGMDADSTKAILQATTDAVAGFGGSAENIERVTDAFVKTSNAGKLSMEEVNTFADNGVNALKILANQYGVTTDEMRDMISAGAVPAQDAIAKLTDGIENGTEGVNGATKAMSGMAASLKAGTLTGAFDGINSAIRAFSLSLIGINPTLKKTDEGYAESEERIKQLTSAVTTISEIIPLLAKVFSGVTDAVGRVLDALVGTNVRLDESAGKWQNVSGALGEFKRYLRDTPTDQLAMIGNLLVAIAVTGPALKIVSGAIGLLQGATALASAAAGIGAGASAAYTAALASQAVASRAAAAALVPLNIALLANPAGVAIAAFVGLTVALGAATFAINDFVGGGDKLTQSSQAQKDKVNDLTGEYYGLMVTQGEHADATLAAKAALDDETVAFEASRQTVGEFLGQCKDTVAAHDELADSLGKGATEADSQAGAVLSLSGQVSDLLGVEGRSVEQKAMLAAKVKALNDAYGEEVMVYDETTDSASMTADAVRALGKAEADRVRSNAAMERYSSLMQDSINVSSDLAKAQRELDAETKNNVDTYGMLGPVQVYTSQSQIDLANTVRSLTEAQADNAERLEEAQQQIQDHATKQSALAQAVREVEEGTLSAEDAAKKYSETTGLAIEATEIQDEITRAAAEAQAEYTKKLTEAEQAVSDYTAANPAFQSALEASGYSVESFAAALADQGLTMDDAAGKMDEYRSRITSAFDEITWKQEENATKVAEIYLKNLSATQNWSANLSYLAKESGLSFNEGFIGAVQDGGVEVWGQVIQQIVDVSRNGGTILVNGAELTAQEYIDVYNAADASAREQLASETQFYSSGLANTQALADGATDGTPAVEEANQNVSEAASVEPAATDSTAAGANVDQTLAAGMNNNTSIVTDANNNIVKASTINPGDTNSSAAGIFNVQTYVDGAMRKLGDVQSSSSSIKTESTIKPGDVDSSAGGAANIDTFTSGQDGAAGKAAASSDGISKLAADHMSSASGDAWWAGHNMTSGSYSQGISAGQGSASGAARTVSKLVADHFSAANGDAWWAGYNMAMGMAQGIASGQSAAVNAAAKMAADSITAAKSTLDENSPSRVFREIGRFAPEGYAIGMEESSHVAVKATQNMATRSVEAARDTGNALKYRLDDDATLARFRTARLETSAGLLNIKTPNEASSGNSEDVLHTLKELKETVELFRKSIGREIAQNAPSELDVYVTNPRDIGRSARGR